MKTPHKAHLAILARGGDPEAIAKLEHGPKLPPGAAHLWGWWLAICQTRAAGMSGPAPITRHDIHAWEADECQGLAPWERRSILALDVIYRKSLLTDEASK